MEAACRKWDCVTSAGNKSQKEITSATLRNVKKFWFIPRRMLRDPKSSTLLQSKVGRDHCILEEEVLINKGLPLPNHPKKWLWIQKNSDKFVNKTYLSGSCRVKPLEGQLVDSWFKTIVLKVQPAEWLRNSNNRRTHGRNAYTAHACLVTKQHKDTSQSALEMLSRTNWWLSEIPSQGLKEPRLCRNLTASFKNVRRLRKLTIDFCNFPFGPCS